MSTIHKVEILNVHIIVDNMIYNNFINRADKIRLKHTNKSLYLYENLYIFMISLKSYWQIGTLMLTYKICHIFQGEMWQKEEVCMVHGFSHTWQLCISH